MQVSALGWAQLGTSGLGQAWLFLTGLTDVWWASWGWLVYSGLGWDSWVDEGPVSMCSLFQAFSHDSPGVPRAVRGHDPKHKHFSSLCLCPICYHPRVQLRVSMGGITQGQGYGEEWTNGEPLLQRSVLKYSLRCMGIQKAQICHCEAIYQKQKYDSRACPGHSVAPVSSLPPPRLHSALSSWLYSVASSLSASRCFSIRPALQAPGRDDKWARLPGRHDCPETQPGACTMQQLPCTMQMPECAVGLDRGHCCRNRAPFETSLLGYNQLCLIRGISK